MLVLLSGTSNGICFGICKLKSTVQAEFGSHSFNLIAIRSRNLRLSPHERIQSLSRHYFRRYYFLNCVRALNQTSTILQCQTRV